MSRKSWNLYHRSCWVGPEIQTLRSSPAQLDGAPLHRRTYIPRTLDLFKLGKKYVKIIFYKNNPWAILFTSDMSWFWAFEMLWSVILSKYVSINSVEPWHIKYLLYEFQFHFFQQKFHVALAWPFSTYYIDTVKQKCR